MSKQVSFYDKIDKDTIANKRVDPQRNLALAERTIMVQRHQNSIAEYANDNHQNSCMIWRERSAIEL